MTQRTSDTTQCPGHFPLDVTEMAQNNSLFVWKTSNYSRVRSKLRNTMNQVTNLNSFFTCKRIANVLGAFSEVVLCDIDVRAFFDVAFDPHISSIVGFAIDRVAKLVLFVPVAGAEDSPPPALKSSLLSSLLPPSLIHSFFIKTSKFCLRLAVLTFFSFLRLKFS